MRFRRLFTSLFLVLALASAMADTARVQDRFKFRGGTVSARDYANWKFQLASAVAASSASSAIVPSGGGTVNTQVGNQSCFTTMGNGRYIQTVFAGVPILVIDGTATETVTITAVSLDSSSGQCTITATFGSAHAKGTFFQSGSFGLAEAVNDLALNAAGGIVVTDPDWQGTTAQITGMSTSIGSTLVAVWDTRATGLVKYGWNGAAYAAIETDSATGVSNVQISIANESGTGTTVNQLAKLTGAPSTAIKAGIGDDKNTAVIGIVTGGAGITGSAQIAAHGTVVACAYDATATTAGDFVTVSTSVAGKCHDAGATVPLDGSVVIGRVLATTAGSVNANTLTYSLMNNSLAQSKTGTGAAVLATTPTLTTPIIGTATATAVKSATANPAATGFTEAATTDTECWRNAANGADVCLSDPGAAAAGTGNSADNLKWNGGGFQGARFIDQSANPANTGAVGLGNTAAINWRNAANGADIGISVNASNFLTYNGTAPTDGSYFVGPENCSMALTTGTFAANPANSGGQSAPALVRAASGNTVLQLTTTAAANTIDVVCDFTPPTRLTSGKGVTITAIQVLYGYQTTALTSIGTLVPNKITYPASAGAAAATVAAIGGALTVTAGTSHGTPGATTTAGQCYSENIVFGTPYAHVTDLVRLNWQNTFVQSAASATVMQICGTIVYYSNINSL